MEFKSPSSGEAGALSSRVPGGGERLRLAGCLVSVQVLVNECVLQEGSVYGHGTADFLELNEIFFSCDF